MIRLVLPLFFLLILLPGIIFAAEFKNGDSITIPEDEIISDDLYVAGGTVTINGTIEGDLIVGGGIIDVKGTVNGDVIAGGGTITLRGIVLDDVRAAGGQITIEGQITDDLLASGGIITLGKGGSIGGNVKVAGGDVILGGISGTVEAAVGKLTIQDSAVIGGNVRYWSEEDAQLDPDAKITGVIEKQTLSHGKNFYIGSVNPVIATIIGIIVTAFFAWFFSYAFPNKTESMLSSSRKEVGTHILWGFLGLVGLPGLAILLCVSVVGLPAGMLILLAFPLVIALGWLVSVLMAGYIATQILTKKPGATWLYALTGAILLSLFGLLPFVGWIVTSFFFLAGLGSLIRFDWRLYDTLRRDKTI